MVIITKHGEFECKDITRMERRELYGKVKVVFQDIKNPEAIHKLSDEFALIAERHLGAGISKFDKIWPNFLRSSARSMASGLVPIMFTPAFAKRLAILSGVCPPN